MSPERAHCCSAKRFFGIRFGLWHPVWARPGSPGKVPGLGGSSFDRYCRAETSRTSRSESGSTET
jgi:hypothetical protein